MPPVSHPYSPKITRKEVLLGIVTFATCYLTAKLGAFLFFGLHTSPALIWPPIGIAFAALVLGGYSMAIPVFLAQLVASTRSGIDINTIITAFAFTIQPLIGIYLLKRFNFEPAFERSRNTILWIILTLLSTLIAPLIYTAGFLLTGVLTTSALFSIGQGWSGGIFSALIITPFILTWYPYKSDPVTDRSPWELASAFLLLTGVTYYLFWTKYATMTGIAVIFFVPAVLLWFAFRFHPRWMTLAISLTSVLGLAGSIVTHLNPSLSLQLLSDEVYLALTAGLFLIFVSVVCERRLAYRSIEANVEELQTALERLAREDQNKADFIAILAHELRNPLAPIVSSLELLKIKNKDPEAGPVIDNAQENSRMMRRLLDDLLDTARISQKKFQLHTESVDLKSVIDQSIWSTSDFLKSRNHALSVSLPEEPIRLSADPVRLKQIVMNLLNNAIKYTPPGGRIALLAAKEGAQVRITVRDNGRGIPVDMIGHVFEPFKQLGKDARVGTGLGIGLYLTRELASFHGGTVAAESAGPGQGSVFTVTLPLAEQAHSSPAAQPKAGIDIESRRVLIVDDNELAASAISKLLEHFGHTTRTSFTGTEALATLPDFDPDVILLDIGLPDVNGHEVARRIRARGFRRTLVALTGYGQESDRAESREAGFDEHLTKPVDIADLLGILSLRLKS